MNLTAEPTRLARVYDDTGAVVTGLIDGSAVEEIEMGWTEALTHLAGSEPEKLTAARTGRRVPWTVDTLACPIEVGSEIYCIGLNYFEHAEEAQELIDAPRAAPIVFGKTLRATVRPGGPLVLPRDVSAQFDWEVELGVVIGRSAVDIDPADAWQYVAGYCVVNDVTARDVQKLHQQWHLGKNVPGSTPLGPWVVARDALATPPDLEVILRVNGVVKQRAHTAQLIHDVPTLLALLSHTTTLQPGDIIATGTPAGVGFVRTPAEFLADGDVVETEVVGVGMLSNIVVHQSRTAV